MIPSPFLVLAQSEPLAFLPEVVALLFASALIAYMCHRIGLVPIAGFLLAGVLIGPNALGLVQDRALIEATAEIGIILLLFTIGIEFSLEKLARISRLIFIGGTLQVGLTIGLVTGIMLLLGIEWQVGVFTGCLIALSSTAIVLKLLDDRGDTNGTVGQISLGIMIFQDLTVIVMVLLVPALAGAGGSALDIGWALLTATLIIVLVLVVARRVMPPVLEVVARTCSNEIFLLSVIAICLGTAYLTNLAGVSLSLGAFLAGIVVSESRFSEYAMSEILPLQILFSATFFVSVGLLLDVGFLLSQPLLVLGVVVAVVLIKVVTTGVSVLVLGYPLRTALLSGFVLAQIGEFSFVLERVGQEANIYAMGLEGVGTQTFIAATVVLMVLTPFITQLGYVLEGRLAQRGQQTLREAAAAEPDPGEAFAHLEHHIIVAGYGPAARELVRVLRGAQIPYVIVTLNPPAANEAEREGLPVLRGDDSRLYTLSRVGIERAKLVVIADDDPATARRITAVARVANPTVFIIVRTRYIAEVAPLREAGADAVIPEELESIVQLFAQVLDEYQIAPAEIDGHIEAMRANGYAVLRTDAAPGSAPPIVCDVNEDCLHTRTVTIRAGAAAAGRAVGELNLGSAYGLEVRAVQRNGQARPDVPPDLVLSVGDRLVLLGRSDQFVRSADLFRVSDEPGEAAALPAPPTCASPHMPAGQTVLPRTQGCEECMAMGESWVHLRICLTCGHVGCCDSSRHQHARRHFEETGHPIIQSFEPGESWGWSFVDQTTLDNLGPPPRGSRADNDTQT